MNAGFRSHAGLSQHKDDDRREQLAPPPVSKSMEHKTKMHPRADAPAGLETDGTGNVIPLAERTPDDQLKASASVKNPEQQAEHPAPMPTARQGEGGPPRPHDPEGRQGATVNKSGTAK
jgi:hypothetical protein